MFGIDSFPATDVFFAGYVILAAVLVIAQLSAPLRNWVITFCGWVLGAVFGYALNVIHFGLR